MLLTKKLRIAERRLTAMKNSDTTITRTLDELGRIVIPREIREKLGWSEKDTFTFHCTENNTLTLQLAEKYQPQ